MFQATNTATAGAHGTLTFTSKGDNVEAVNRTTEVTTADGVDLVVTGGNGESTVKVRPGDVVHPTPLDFYNAGNRSSAGFTLLVHFDHQLVPDRYENCSYSPVGAIDTLMACDSPDTALPVRITGTVGQTVRVEVGVHNIGPAALNASRVGPNEPALFFQFEVPAGVRVVSRRRPAPRSSTRTASSTRRTGHPAARTTAR